MGLYSFIGWITRILSDLIDDTNSLAKSIVIKLFDILLRYLVVKNWLVKLSTLNVIGVVFVIIIVKSVLLILNSISSALITYLKPFLSTSRAINKLQLSSILDNPWFIGGSISAAKSASSWFCFADIIENCNLSL